jgi:ligand-binding sensor domain-containing protein
MKKLFFIFTLLLFSSSCKLLSPDKNNPLVNLSIQGDKTEISRLVTLHLEIDDESDIDYVSVFIDDSLAHIQNKNHKIIEFDVTPFADELEHSLFVTVADVEGNVGQSQVLEVVITKYPGWRTYDITGSDIWDITVDANGLIWLVSAFGHKIIIFNPETNEVRTLTPDNSELPNEMFSCVEVIDGSRVWIATESHICEYHYDLNRWINVIPIPIEIIGQRFQDSWKYVGSMILDEDKNLLIGVVFNQFYYYDHQSFSVYERSEVYQPWKMIMDLNGDIFIAGDPGVDVFRDGQVYSFSDFPYQSGWDIDNIVMDIYGNIWTEGMRNGGFLRYNGSAWERIQYPQFNQASDRPDIGQPLLVDSNGIMYSNRLSYEYDENWGDMYKSKGIVTFDGITWTNWEEYDTPFNDINSIQIIPSEIVEASNGDLWMVLNYKLTRYRPSLGGYP